MRTVPLVLSPIIIVLGAVGVARGVAGAGFVLVVIGCWSVYGALWEPHRITLNDGGVILEAAWTRPDRSRYRRVSAPRWPLNAVRPPPGVMGHLEATLGARPRAPSAPPLPASVVT